VPLVAAGDGAALADVLAAGVVAGAVFPLAPTTGAGGFSAGCVASDFPQPAHTKSAATPRIACSVCNREIFMTPPRALACDSPLELAHR
jgi:hypothetical protein